MAGALENEGKISFWNNQIKSHVTPNAQFILMPIRIFNLDASPCMFVSVKKLKNG